MSRELVRQKLNAEVTPGMVSALDVGCGPGTFLHTLPAQIVTRWALDVTWDDLRQVRGAILQLGPAEAILPTFDDASVDLVYALDFIEHLEKPKSLELLHEMQRIARRRVVIFTPFGFHVQDHGPDHPQTHRSGWWPEDLQALGFTVNVFDCEFGKVFGLLEPGIWATWEAR